MFTLSLSAMAKLPRKEVIWNWRCAGYLPVDTGCVENDRSICAEVEAITSAGQKQRETRDEFHCYRLSDCTLGVVFQLGEKIMTLSKKI